jgi:Xaa-Pro aminopeptidase
MSIDRAETERRARVLKERAERMKAPAVILPKDYEAEADSFNWDDPENPVPLSVGEKTEYLGKALVEIGKFVSKMGGELDYDLTASVRHSLSVKLEISFDLSDLKRFLSPDTGQDQGRAV